MNLHFLDAFVTLATNNIETLVKFYTQLLGVSPHIYSPNRYAEFQLPNLRLAIFQPSSTQVSEFLTDGKTGMSLCLEVQDLDNAIAHLHNLGYPPPGDLLTASHGREIYAYDPAGNRLILHQSQ